MAMLITLGIIWALILGFSLSGLVVSSMLINSGRTLKGAAFVLFGSIVSVSVMALMVFIIWPAQLVL